MAVHDGTATARTLSIWAIFNFSPRRELNAVLAARTPPEDTVSATHEERWVTDDRIDTVTNKKEILVNLSTVCQLPSSRGPDRRCALFGPRVSMVLVKRLVGWPAWLVGVLDVLPFVWRCNDAATAVAAPAAKEGTLNYIVQDAKALVDDHLYFQHLVHTVKGPQCLGPCQRPTAIAVEDLGWSKWIARLCESLTLALRGSMPAWRRSREHGTGVKGNRREDMGGEENEKTHRIANWGGREGTACFRLPSSAVAPRSGAEAGLVEALGAVGTIVERGHSVKDSEGSDRVMGECEDSDKPVGSVLSSIGLLEAEDGWFGGLEGPRGSALSWRETAAGGEVVERGGVGVEVAEVTVARGIFIPEASATAGSGEVTGMERLPVVV
ncbi:hypothetical protein EDB92DRAFT_1819152 [Lactarius akahatsu]|uniref:Uncharacterized protein n=1 Tax=Lactarius akahatsu TaxID=416441 RepID=A0AAD4Q7C1_9AGAM|nr:hypothetical protein EDB92DRAFT_1819152 [Lactarius akahatsu]